MKKSAPIPKETLVLYGSETNPEIIQDKKRYEAQGRTVEIQPRPAFDSGMGPCGKHLCSCEEMCQQR